MPSLKRLVSAALLGCLVMSGWALGAPLEVKLADSLQYVYPDVYKTAETTGGPIRFVALRSGIHSAHVVVSSAEAIKGLKAEVSDLKGAGTIPGTALKIAYGVADGAPARGKGQFFDSLETEAPAEIAPAKGGLAVQNVWLKLYVPENAKPGDYTGKLTVTAEGSKVEMPIAAKVHDWVMPSPHKWSAHLDAIQSPESVAMAYDVELWSDEHLKLLDKSFEVLGEMGQKTLFISVVRRTHFGNEHAIVRWYRDDDGELQPDFTNVEKYLDVALPRLGKIPGIIFYCWEPVESMGHAGGTGTAGRTTDRPMQYTLWDRETGKLGKRTGPAWGTPESKALWKRFNEGVRPVLAKRGVESSMLYGLIGDARPTKTSMDDICTGVENPLWAVHSHHYAAEWQGYKVGMGIALWGIHLNICNPEQGRGFGWNTDFWLAYYPREFNMSSPLNEYRYKMEMWNGALSLFEMQQKGNSRYACGLGRIGGDFWKVIKDRQGRPRATLAGSFPESYWGQLNLNYCISSILGRGKAGAVPTIRSEAFREGSQDVEARVFVEKAIELPEYRAKLGEEMAKRIREMLDDRIRMVNVAGGPRKDQTLSKVAEKDRDSLDSNEKLYAAAAEIAAKLGTMYIEENSGDLYSVEEFKAAQKKK